MRTNRECLQKIIVNHIITMWGKKKRKGQTRASVDKFVNKVNLLSQINKCFFCQLMEFCMPKFLFYNYNSAHRVIISNK